MGVKALHTIKSVKGLLPCTLSNTLGYDPLYYRARTHKYIHTYTYTHTTHTRIHAHARTHTG